MLNNTVVLSVHYTIIAQKKTSKILLFEAAR